MPRLRSVIVALLFAGLTAAVVAQAPPTPADPKAKAPEVKAPDAKAPEVKAPEAKAPEAKAPTPAPVPEPAPKAPDAKPPEVKAPEAKADDKIALTLKLEKGKAFYEKMSTVVIQKLKVQGQDLSQNQEQTFVFEWMPEKQEGDKWTLKMKIIQVKMKIDISNNTIEYDSANKNATGPVGAPGLTDFFKNLVDSEFTVLFNAKENKVEKVDGRDAFIKRLSSGNTQLEGLLRKILTEEAERQMTDPTFGLLPAEPKAMGATWDSKSTLNLGPIGSYEVANKSTVKSKEKDDVNVEIVPTLTYKLPSDAGEALLFKIKSGEIKSETTTPGSMRYDAKAGRIIEAKIPVKLQGTLDVTIGGTDTKIELRQEQTTTVSMSDTNPTLTPEKK